MEVRWGDRTIECKNTQILFVGIKEAGLGKVNSVIDYLFSCYKIAKIILINLSFYCFISFLT